MVNVERKSKKNRSNIDLGLFLRSFGGFVFLAGVGVDFEKFVPLGVVLVELLVCFFVGTACEEEERDAGV